MTPRPVAVGLFAYTALLLSGCSPEAAVPSPPPAAEGEALFASDEEALAAAEAAYVDYLAVTDDVLGSGGAVDRLSEVATGQVLEEDKQRAANFAARGLRTVGGTKILDFSLQQHTSGDSMTTEVVGYGCVDTLNLTVVDADGADIGDPERQPTATYELVFVPNRAGQLVLSRSTFWMAGPQCEN